MAAKAVVRDVARVFGQSYGFADSIAKLIPFELGITLKDALEKEPELQRRYKTEEETRAILDMAMSLEGLVRNAGMHAGGVVIAPSVLTDFAPLFCDETGHSVVTQFDKDDVEAAGLVKFDFLGLRTLTIIDWAVKIINAQRERKGEPPLDINALPMDDAATYELLKRCETTAVFQLESRGMKDLIRRLQPDCFEDIVALVALFRPGPLQSGMVDDFIARKHGKTTGPIDYLHPDLKPVLAPTYGVILYQEQVMQIAQVLAGYTLGGADLLRRAMGKKKPEEMAKQRSIFVDGATARGVRAAHGRAHLRPDGEVRRLRLQQVALRRVRAAVVPDGLAQGALSGGVHVGGAVVRHGQDRQGRHAHRRSAAHAARRSSRPTSTARTTCSPVSGERSIRYGLGAIKGVGQSVVEMLVAEREAHGAFRDLAGPVPAQRPEPHESPRARGADPLRRARPDRREPRDADARAAVGDAAGRPDDPRARRRPGRHVRSDGRRAAPAPAVTLSNEVLPDWSRRVRLDGERDTLGLYLTGHPFEEFEHEVRPIISGRIADITGDRPPPSATKASSSSAASRRPSPAWCSISASAAAA